MVERLFDQMESIVRMEMNSMFHHDFWENSTELLKQPKIKRPGYEPGRCEGE
jgi:hypothetical protein